MKKRTEQVIVVVLILAAVALVGVAKNRKRTGESAAAPATVAPAAAGTMNAAPEAGTPAAETGNEPEEKEQASGGEGTETLEASAEAAEPVNEAERPAGEEKGAEEGNAQAQENEEALPVQEEETADAGSASSGDLPPPDFSLAATEAVDFASLARYGLPVIVDYGWEGCPPCRAMEEDYRTVHEEMVGKAFVKYADVEKYPGVADNVPIQVTPTQVFFGKDGKPFVPSASLSSKIRFTTYRYGNIGKVAFTVHMGLLTADELRMILAEMGVEQ